MLVKSWHFCRADRLESLTSIPTGFAAVRGSPDLAQCSTEGLPVRQKPGDLRSGVSAASGDPRQTCIASECRVYVRWARVTSLVGGPAQTRPLYPTQSLTQIIHELVGKASSLSTRKDRQDAYPTFPARD